MTSPVRSLLVLAIAATVSLPPAYAQTGATTVQAPAKPLTSAEKKFIKDAAEQMVAEIHLVEITKHGETGSAELKKSNAEMNKDLGEAWGALATIAQNNKVDFPKTDTTAAEKSTLEKLRKQETDKFDKAFLKVISKETKKTAQIFKTAEKSVQNPELKAYITTWGPKIAAHHEQVEAAEDAAKKAK